MRILYVAQKYDYGDPTKGLSFEHYNFYSSLIAMGAEVTYFDYPAVAQEHGKTGAGRRLEAIIKHERPAVLFGVVQRDLIDKRALRRIAEQTDTVSINWFCDDHWQFDSLAKAWAPCFNHVVTTSQTALARYREHRIDHVIKSQWGANHALYKPASDPTRYDVSFVGQPYGIRGQAIEALRSAGINVRAWGAGWPDGKLDQDAMIRVFSQSKINLNFADASSNKRTRLQTLACGHTVESMRDKPGLWRVWQAAQHAARWSQARAERLCEPPPRQIKGRTFEVPACGGFLLTQPAENLHDYLAPGIDCATFDSIDELVEQVRYYLNNEEERRAIANNGYRRTLAEHTYQARFAHIFQTIGIDSPKAPTALAA